MMKSEEHGQIPDVIWGVQSDHICAGFRYTLRAVPSTAKSVMLHSETAASCVVVFSTLRQSFFNRKKVLSK